MSSHGYFQIKFKKMSLINFFFQKKGQEKEVVIYKLITEGTIEEGMNLIANEKLKLEKEVTSTEGECKLKHLIVALIIKYFFNIYYSGYG